MAPDAGEGEHRPRVCALERKPVPGRRLHIAVGLAEGRRRYQAAPLLERFAPKLARENLVVAHVRYRPRRSLVLQEHEAPAHRDDLPLTIVGTAHDGREVLREDGAGRFERGRAVVRHAEEPRYHVPLFY